MVLLSADKKMLFAMYRERVNALCRESGVNFSKH